MYTVFDIADWFLAHGKNITNKKLQKLVYYAYAWYIALYNESRDNIVHRFFPARFEAWVHGAVEPSLYKKYKDLGSSDIPQYVGTLKKFSVEEMDVLQQVLDVYGDYNGNDLESICHQESPWRNARKGKKSYEPSTAVISDSDMYECYASRL